MIKYVDTKGVSKVGEKLKANKTAIEGTLEQISTLNGKLSEIETGLSAFSIEEVREALEEGYGAA